MLPDSNLSIYISKRHEVNLLKLIKLLTSGQVKKSQTMAHLSFNREKNQFSSIETKFSLFKVYLVELAQQL